MTRTGRFLAVTTLILLAAAGAARSEDLSIDTYFELTLARLELAATRWEQTGKSPTEAELAALFSRYNTTAETYNAYAGEHRAEVGSYLEQNPGAQETIDKLRARIQRAIDRASKESTEEK